MNPLDIAFFVLSVPALYFMGKKDRKCFILFGIANFLMMIVSMTSEPKLWGLFCMQWAYQFFNIRNYFMWKEEKEEKDEIEETEKKEKKEDVCTGDPISGEKWVFVHKDGSPWPKLTSYPPVIITDVKDGWVRYDIYGNKDQRMKIKSFLNCYERQGEAQ